LQVVKAGGGDCAHRGRVFTVLLRQHGVNASKLAVYNSGGDPVHAIVEVKTEKGAYVVDPLFDVIHEDESGAPIPLQELQRDPTLLRESITRAVAAVAMQWRRDIHSRSMRRSCSLMHFQLPARAHKSNSRTL